MEQALAQKEADHNAVEWGLSQHHGELPVWAGSLERS